MKVREKLENIASEARADDWTTPELVDEILTILIEEPRLGGPPADCLKQILHGAESCHPIDPPA